MKPEQAFPDSSEALSKCHYRPLSAPGLKLAPLLVTYEYFLYRSVFALPTAQVKGNP